MNWNIVGVVIDLIAKLMEAFSSKPKELPKDDDPWNEKDYWYDWKGIDYATFWKRIDEIEMAGDPDAVDAMARKHGLPGMQGYSRVKNTFTRHFNDDPAFLQALTDLRMGQAQGQMAAAAANENLLEPIEGVSVQMWATLAGELSRAGNDEGVYHKLLAEAGLDAEKFERVQDQWMQRMRSSEDPMGAAAIATEYGKHFSATSPTVTAGGPEPVSLERYAEIMGAQAAWSDEGREIAPLLQQHFGITIPDYSDYGMYWNQRLIKDNSLSGRLNHLVDHYKAQHRTTSSADADLVL